MMNDSVSAKDWKVVNGGLKIAVVAGVLPKSMINELKRSGENYEISTGYTAEITKESKCLSFVADVVVAEESIEEWRKFLSNGRKKSHQKRNKFDNLLDSSNSRKGFR